MTAAAARLRLSPPSAASSPVESAPTPASPLTERRRHLVAHPAATSMWSPPAPTADGPMTTDRARRATPAPRALAAEVEAALIATITRPLAPGETHLSGNANKEHALCALLAELAPVPAFDLGRRLDADRDADPVAVAFRRLAADRRGRVRRFLADARRRAALAQR